MIVNNEQNIDAQVAQSPAAAQPTVEQPVVEPVEKLPETTNSAEQQTIRDIKKDFARIIGVFGSDQQGARDFVNAINDFIVNGRVNVAALANSGALVDADGSNLLSGYRNARSKPYNREFAKVVRAYAKGEVGQYLGDGNIQDVTSFENVMVTDQKAATDGVIDSAAIQGLKNAILRM